MLKILVIGAHPALNSIKLELEKKDIHLTTVFYSNIRIEIVNNKVEIFVTNEKIDNYDFVWINSSWSNRQLADAICVYLLYKKIPFTEVEGEKSKLVDNIHLALNGVRIPNTIYCKTKKYHKNTHHIERVCKYPIIIKTTRGSLGSDIYLATNRQELMSIINNELKKTKNYICQEFIPNLYDFRIIVSAQKCILSAEKRIRSENEFRNNAHLGAREEFIDAKKLCNELSDISIKAAKALNINWAGVDIVQSTYDNKYYILELNRRPGLTLGSSEITAAFDHILSLLSERGLYV